MKFNYDSRYIISLIDPAMYENSSFILLSGERNFTCPSQRTADSLDKNGKSLRHIIKSFEECKYAAQEMNATFKGTLNGSKHSSPRGCSYSKNAKGEVHLSWNDR